MTDRFNLTGQAALITGGASGIGKAIAQAILEAGGKVWIGSRTAEKVETAVEELSESAGEDAVLGQSLDVTDDQSVEETTAKALESFGRIDILVNSAGIIIKKPTQELTLDEFNTVHESHVTGTLRCCKAVAAAMKEQGSGSIINIASISSFVDLVEVTAYAAAKSAILGLTRSLANEWAKYGIRTNAIAPGPFPTEGAWKRLVIPGLGIERKMKERNPLGRFGDQIELANLASYLVSDGAGYINGEVVTIDGGEWLKGAGQFNQLEKIPGAAWKAMAAMRKRGKKK